MGQSVANKIRLSPIRRRLAARRSGPSGKSFWCSYMNRRSRALRRFGCRGRNDHGGDIEIEAVTRRVLRGAFVGEGRESGVGAAVVPSPSHHVSHLHRYVRSERQHLFYENPCAAPAIPLLVIWMKMNQYRHAQPIRFTKYILQLADLFRILELKVRGGQMEFESAAKSYTLAVLDGGDRVRLDRVDAAETDKALRISPYLPQRPFIFPVYHCRLVANVHQSSAQQVRFGKGGGTSHTGGVERGDEILGGIRPFLLLRIFFRVGTCSFIEKPGGLGTLEMRMMVGCGDGLALSRRSGHRNENEKRREAGERCSPARADGQHSRQGT